MGRLSVEAVRRKLFNYTKRLRDVHFLTKEEAEALVKVEAKRLGVEHPRIISQVFEKAWESQKREPFARTQVGNAQRFVAQHGTEVRYCHGKNTWFIWDGQRWAEDRMNSIQEKAKETVERILVEAENVSDEDEKKELRSWWSRSQTSGQFTGMLKFASTDKKIAILPEQFDTNKWVMNCENGTVDLKSGELNEHYTWDYITKLAPIEFNLNARCPRWRAFISQIMDGDSESIEHLQRVVGYALSGVTEEKCLFLLLGPTDSGKTTFIETLRHVLGDYAKATEFKTFLYSKYGGSTVRNDIARLEGARFVSATEAARDQEFDQPIVKIITGGDTMVARFLYKEFTEYEPEFKVFLATNHPPKVSIADDAIMNRIHVIPFDVSILKKEQERNLKEKLIEERNGILAWAVKGCLKWQEDRNLKPSRKAKAAIKRYRADADVIWKFIDERCYRFKNNYTPFTALWVEWQEWCNDNYVDQGSIKGFAQDLERHGYKAVRKRIDGVQHWVRKGLLLKSEVSEQLERRVGESLDSK